MRTNARKIFIIGDIDHNAYEKFTKDLAEMEDISNEQIHIVLSSDGGDGQVALAFYDRIRMSDCPISITGTGLVASAAALILVAPRDVNLRSMTESSWLMVHDDSVPSGVLDGMRVVHAEKYIKQMRLYEQQWNLLMEKSTQTPEKTWDLLHKKESYLTASECLKLGVIGAII